MEGVGQMELTATAMRFRGCWSISGSRSVIILEGGRASIKDKG
jgi:hypothetical protein